MHMFQEFRRSQEPDAEARKKLGPSYYNLLEEYNSKLLREKLPGVFETIDVRENEVDRYPGLRITYNYSTIFLAAQSHCDPIKYMYNDSLAAKTLDAHLWINGYQEDLGCDSGKQLYDKGVRQVVVYEYQKLMVQIILFVKLTKSVPNIDQKDYTEKKHKHH